MSADMALLTTESRLRLPSRRQDRAGRQYEWRRPSRSKAYARESPTHSTWQAQVSPPGSVRCRATSAIVVGKARSSRERKPLAGALSSASRSTSASRTDRCSPAAALPLRFQSGSSRPASAARPRRARRVTPVGTGPRAVRRLVHRAAGAAHPVEDGDQAQVRPSRGSDRHPPPDRESCRVEAERDGRPGLPEGRPAMANSGFAHTELRSSRRSSRVDLGQAAPAGTGWCTTFSQTPECHSSRDRPVRTG